MPLAYRDSLSGGDSTFTVSQVSVAAPTVAVGDLEIIWAASAFLAPTTAPILLTPSGWNLGGYGNSVPSAGGQVNTRAHMFWRISPNTGSAATLDAGANAVFVYVRLSYSGGPAVTALRQVTFGSTTAATSAVLSSITANGGTMLSTFISLGAAQVSTHPSGMTERQDNATYGVNSADQQVAAAGATGTRTYSWSTTSESVWGFAEFRPEHASTGALVGQGSTVAGSAARTRAHPSTGALVGQGSTVVGSAQHNVPHATSGALIGQGSSVVGAANRAHDHASSGVLTGQGSEIVGSAARTRAHPSSGVLVGQGSEVVGVAARTRAHGASGALVGPGSEIVGSADRQGAAGTHDATGALVGQGSVVSGAAARLRAFSASGALVGQGSVVSGSAARVGPAVSHDATGVLIGQGSQVSGAAQIGDVTPFGGGFFSMALRRRLFEEEMREKLTELPPQVAEVIENAVIESVDRPKKPAQKELRQAFERENVPYREAYRKAVVSLVQEMRQREDDDEEEEAIALAVASLI